MTASDSFSSLKHHFLIAMPALKDSSFEHSVTYICSHDGDGAMGIVINKTASDIDFTDLLAQLNIRPSDDQAIKVPVHSGGPVEPGRLGRAVDDP